MWLFVLLSAGFASLVAYMVYTLRTSQGSDYADNSLDAFIDDSAGGKSALGEEMRVYMVNNGHVVPGRFE